MLKMALRQAVELGSFERAADNFSELTGVAISASRLKRLVLTYGAEVAKADEQEAVVWRRKPPPDSEVLVVSADGVMVHLLEEGWKEVRWRASRLRLLASRGRKQRAHCAWRSIRIELAYGMPKRSPTPTEPKVVVAGWKRPNGSSALTMAQSGSGRWSSSVLPVALNSSAGGTCCSTSGRLHRKRWDSHQLRPLPGWKRKKPA